MELHDVLVGDLPSNNSAQSHFGFVAAHLNLNSRRPLCCRSLVSMGPLAAIVMENLDVPS